MRRLLMLTASFLLVFSFFSSHLTAEKPVYIGAKKCKGCHSGASKKNVFEKWQAGPHVNALESLKKKGQHKNPKCVGCHSTGYKDGGFKLGDGVGSTFAGVQCEACHGAGSVYRKMGHMKDEMKAIESGLIIPMESLCIKCHNSDCPSFKGFNYKKYYSKITHAYIDRS